MICVLAETKRLANGIAAGGLAVNSKMERMLEVVPEHIHDRSGIFLGSEGEVQKVIDAPQAARRKSWLGWCWGRTSQ